MALLGKYDVIMRFGSGLSSAEQGEAMLRFEQLMIRLTNKPIEVFKETMADDSKLRNQMTEEQRNKL